MGLGACLAVVCGRESSAFDESEDNKFKNV